MSSAETRAPHPHRHRILGWLAVILGTSVSMLWAFWGTLENFHEGWLGPTLGWNLLWTLAYLAPALITMAMALLALHWPRAGAAVYVAIGLGVSGWILKGRKLTIGLVMSWFPFTLVLCVIGLLFWFGRVRSRRWARRLIIGLPLLTMAAYAVEPTLRIAGRIDDGDRSARTVVGRGIDLVWAPAGPGWVRESRDACDWQEAMRRVSLLSEDGTRLLSSPQNLWRLPSADEAVRSMARHGRNCQGVWDQVSELPEYDTRPDKESPLWDAQAPIIYWWTSTEKDAAHAYRIVYDGRVFLDPKTLRLGSLGFRAVKDAR
jgi:hypothetical protein